MKLILRAARVLVVVLLTVVLGAVAAGQMGFFKGTEPGGLGVRDGRLKGLSATGNSVSSQAGLYPEHPQFKYSLIAPLALRGDGPATMAKLNTLVLAMAGTMVVKREPDYLYAQFTTPLMQYVDDVEFWFDPAGQVVQVRSASRVGKGDLGANRKRVEAVRAALAALP